MPRIYETMDSVNERNETIMNAKKSVKGYVFTKSIQF